MLRLYKNNGFLPSLAPIISYFTVYLSFPIEFDKEFDYTCENMSIDNGYSLQSYIRCSDTVDLVI